jgi:two-component system sensor kinase FixL
VHPFLLSASCPVLHNEPTVADVQPFVPPLSAEATSTGVDAFTLLPRNEAKFRDLLEAAPDAMVIVDHDGKIVYINTQTEKLFGYLRAELLGSSVDRLVPIRQREKHPSHRRAYALEPKTRQMGSALDLYASRKDGSEFPVEISLSALDTEEGLLVSSAIRDVSQRKQAEALLTQSLHEKDLLLSEVSQSAEQNRLLNKLLIEGGRDYALYMLDAGGHVTAWNVGAERITGYTEAEIIGKHFSIFYEANDVKMGLPELELRNAAEMGRREEEGRRVRKNGSGFWANVIIAPLRSPEGILRGFAKITRDVSERKEMDRALQITLEQLQRSNGELQEFAMIASHDLQEPLRKVQMFGDRLKAEFGETLGSAGQDYISRMQNAASRGQTLIQGLLAYSRVTTKALPRVLVDLGAIATEVASDLEARIAQVGGAVEIGTLPTIEADPLQMRQLLQNLVGNALKFHRPEVPPVVRISATAIVLQDGYAGWRIAVSDNGIGFDEKYLDRIFKLFQRLHERGVYEGAGMGLAICRKIAEGHHGSITARSTPGERTTILVDLPTRPPKESRGS